MDNINPDPDPSLQFLISLAENQEYPVLQDVFRADQAQLINFAEWVSQSEPSNVELSSLVVVCISNDENLRNEQRELFDRLENVIFNKIFMSAVEDDDVTKLGETISDWLRDGHISVVDEMIENMDPQTLGELMTITDANGKTLLLSSIEYFDSAHLINKILEKCPDEQSRINWVSHVGNNNETSILTAVKIGNNLTLKELLKVLPDAERMELLNKADNRRDAPLSFAIKEGKAELLKTLFEACPSPDSRWEFLQQNAQANRGILYAPIWNQKLDVLEEILDGCPQERIHDLLFLPVDQDISTLSCAAGKGNVELIRMILDYCPENDLEEFLLLSDQNGDNVLHHAVRSGDLEVFSEILNICPTSILNELLSKTGRGNSTVLDLCAKDGKAAMAQEFFRAASRPFEVIENDPFEISIRIENNEEVGEPEVPVEARREEVFTEDEMTNFLLGTDDSGNTALMSAIRGGHGTIAQEIMAHCPDEYKAELFLKTNNEGATTLMSSLGHNTTLDQIEGLWNVCPEESRIEYLMSQDSRGRTCIMYAAERCGQDILQNLISKCPEDRVGELLLKSDDDDKTALMYAATRGDTGIFQAVIGAFPEPIRTSLCEEEDSPAFPCLELAIDRRRTGIVSSILASCHISEEILAKVISSSPSILGDEQLQSDILARISNEQIKKVLVLEYKMRSNYQQEVDNELEELLGEETDVEFFEKAIMYAPHLTENLLSNHMTEIKEVIDAIEGIDELPLDTRMTLLPFFPPSEILSTVNELSAMERQEYMAIRVDADGVDCTLTQGLQSVVSEWVDHIEDERYSGAFIENTRSFLKKLSYKNLAVAAIDSNYVQGMVIKLISLMQDAQSIVVIPLIPVVRFLNMMQGDALSLTMLYLAKASDTQKIAFLQSEVALVTGLDDWVNIRIPNIKNQIAVLEGKIEEEEDGILEDYKAINRDWQSVLSYRTTVLQSKMLIKRLEHFLKQNNPSEELLEVINTRVSAELEKVLSVEVDLRVLQEKISGELLLASGEIKVPEPPLDFICPINKTLMEDPVKASDGFTYEREAIERWIRTRYNSPFTRKHMRIEELEEDVEKKSAIEAWKVVNTVLANVFEQI
ncbi:MAG: ankyrin repeat protein [Chlamydiales bacterium]|jgi:ankyrin repeat protein